MRKRSKAAVARAGTVKESAIGGNFGFLPRRRSHRAARLGMVLVMFGALMVLNADAALATGSNTRVSVSNEEAQAGGDSRRPSISDDGQLVVFESDASNLVAGDTNNATDVFLRDRQSGTTTRMSLTEEGTQTGNSGTPAGVEPAISGDGEYVAFVSGMALVSQDTTESYDVYVVEVDTGDISLATVSSDETIGTQGSPHDPTLSDDGSKVAYTSYSSDLVPGDTNNTWDIFVRDLDAGTTVRASVAGDGSQASCSCPGDGGSMNPWISGSGQHVAFQSGADNLVPGDANAKEDIFVRNLTAGTTVLASRTYQGSVANDHSHDAALSDDGNVVVFTSAATNVALTGGNDPEGSGERDIFLRDISAASTVQVNDGVYWGYQGVPTDDGSAVVYDSGTDGNTIFRFDRGSGESMKLTHALDGGPTDGPSNYPSISSNGRFVAYQSAATNLIASDTNGKSDVFVHDYGFLLSITRSGTGAGKVTSDISGLDCGADDSSVGKDCTENYAGGTAVTLTAAPDADSVFDGWSGACSGSTETCVVTMDQARSVTATFHGTTVLSVGHTGGEHVTMTSSPGASIAVRIARATTTQELS